MTMGRCTPLLVLFVLLAACKPAEQAVAPVTTPVGTGIVTTGPAQPPVLTSGVVVTKEELKLSFKIAGIIRKIAVQEGDAVRAGQQLAALELVEVDAQVEQARQLAAKADRNLVRSIKLRDEKVISEEELEGLRTQAAVSRASVRATEFNRNYSTIVAIRDGIVLRKLVEEREFAQPGQAILVLGPRDGGFIVRAGLADREIVRLRLGDPATITMDAFPGQTLSGRLSVLPAAADRATGLFEVEVAVDPGALKLVSGLVARLRIDPALAAATTLPYVPIAAVIEADGQRAAVFVLQAGKARRRPVRVAFIGPTSVAIAEGLKAGETVVTDGALYLEDGDEVRVVAPASPAS